MAADLSVSAISSALVPSYQLSYGQRM